MDNTEKQVRNVIKIFTDKLKYESDITEITRLQEVIKELETQLKTLNPGTESSVSQLDFLIEHKKSRI